VRLGFKFFLKIFLGVHCFAMRYRPIEAESLWDAPGMPHLCFMANPINGRYAAVETVRRPTFDGLAALVRGWLGGW